MNELNNIFCEGVTQITLSRGVFHLTFSNQTEYGRPSVNGDFLQLSVPANGFLHLAACVQETMNQLIAAEKESAEQNNAEEVPKETSAKEEAFTLDAEEKQAPKKAPVKKKTAAAKKEAAVKETEKAPKTKKTTRKKTKENAK